MVATRSSLRQAARPSPVPVSQRAQQKLMRELQFIDTPTGPPDAAVTEYIDLYGQNLPRTCHRCDQGSCSHGQQEAHQGSGDIGGRGGCAGDGGSMSSQYQDEYQLQLL